MVIARRFCAGSAQGREGVGPPRARLARSWRGRAVCRHAGVGGAAIDALLQRAMSELDASSVGWVIEDVLGALGERQFLAAIARVSAEASRANVEKASYWARGALSQAGRDELARIVAARQ